MAISLAATAAGWLTSAGALFAQTKDSPIEVDWATKEFPRPAPIGPAPISPAPIRGESRSHHSGIKTVTFTRPPAAAAQTQARQAVASQVPAGGRPYATMEADAEYFRTDLPGLDRLFERKSESQFYDTVRAEAQARGQRQVFPQRVPVSREKFQPRRFEQMVGTVEPAFVMHRRVLFEQPNFDRHGWELGNLQPGISTLRFVYDVVALPYHTWTRPLEHWDSSAGKCLPGDAVPLYLYREQLSFTGLVAQAGVVAGGFVAFP
ncbi:MAG: hypothetical protein L0Y71_24480 [Gemmataceae bacterium]|nr:hypothetical protein [Gemmataceae bacterium]